MKKCPNCDADIEELRNVCPFCGTVLKQQSNETHQSNDDYINRYAYEPRPTVNDSGSFGYWLLGFFIPLVGIVLYFVWKTEQPKNAQKCLWGAIISMIASFVLSVLKCNSPPFTKSFS